MLKFKLLVVVYMVSYIPKITNVDFRCGMGYHNLPTFSASHYREELNIGVTTIFHEIDFSLVRP